MHTDMIPIEFQKAFDTLDHKILQKYMTCFALKIPVIKFIITVDDVFSEIGILSCVSFKVFFRTTLVFDLVLMTSLNHNQKVALIFMLMIRVFSAKTISPQN